MIYLLPIGLGLIVLIIAIVGIIYPYHDTYDVENYNKPKVNVISYDDFKYMDDYFNDSEQIETF